MFDLKLQQLEEDIVRKINESQVPISVIVLLLQKILHSAEVSKDATLREQKEKAIAEVGGNLEQTENN